jgi:hypothetical protein
MTKIQFSVQDGVRIVDSFDDDATIINQSYVSDFLDECKEGELFGCEVDDKILNFIKSVYDVK